MNWSDVQLPYLLVVCSSLPLSLSISLSSSLPPPLCVWRFVYLPVSLSMPPPSPIPPSLYLPFVVACTDERWTKRQRWRHASAPNWSTEATPWFFRPGIPRFATTVGCFMLLCTLTAPASCATLTAALSSPPIGHRPINPFPAAGAITSKQNLAEGFN